MKIPKILRSLFDSNAKEEASLKSSDQGAIESHVEMLRKLPWLSGLDEDVFKKVLAGFECRQFDEGSTLLKQDDPDNGMFVIIAGKVNIVIRGITMTELGVGDLIGEMSVLTGYPRSASIVAVSQVTVVWMDSDRLKSIMKKSPELENRLWEFASRRFAMNLLGRREPYNQWEQNIFIQWLAAGEVKVPDENGRINLKRKVGVLVTGTATLDHGGLINSPASLTGSDYIFSKEARVFLRDK